MPERIIWSCIGVLFAVQIAGSLVIQRLFQLGVSDVIIPVFILTLGLFLSFFLRSWGQSQRLGPWQWWIPVIVYALFIFSLSNRSYPQAVPYFSTKAFHPVEYAVLGLLLCVASLSVLGGKGSFSFAARVISGGVFFGALDEFHQSFIPGRSARIDDVIFWDLLGIILACSAFLVVWFLLRRPARKV